MLMGSRSVKRRPLHRRPGPAASTLACCCVRDIQARRVTGTRDAWPRPPQWNFHCHANREVPMGKRLTQIATRTGDNGTTGLGDNTRVSKDSLRVHAMGDVDELNSHIGVLLCEELPDATRDLLVEIQHQL